MNEFRLNAMSLITLCLRLTQMGAIATSLVFCAPVLADELVIPGSGNPEFVLRALDRHRAVQDQEKTPHA